MIKLIIPELKFKCNWFWKMGSGLGLFIFKHLVYLLGSNSFKIILVRQVLNYIYICSNYNKILHTCVWLFFYARIRLKKQLSYLLKCLITLKDKIIWCVILYIIGISLVNKIWTPLLHLTLKVWWVIFLYII